jgi:hypothetical protein
VGIGVGEGVIGPVEDACGTESTFVALQLAVVPPFKPAHVHVHGPVPETVDVVPVTQRFAVGADESVAPLLVPQVPFVGVGVGVTTDERVDTVTPVLCCERFPAASNA